MPGFNSEIKYKGGLFHIQTQDKGPTVQYVESFVYKSGKLLSSRKTFYTQFLSSPLLREKILQIMEEQHNTLLKEITEGKFDHILNPDEK
jgi:hypothetical protein